MLGDGREVELVIPDGVKAEKYVHTGGPVFDPAVEWSQRVTSGSPIGGRQF